MGMNTPALTNADLSTLTDSQLGELASMVLTPDQWDRLEDEMARRVSMGTTDEWSFDLPEDIKVVS